MLQLERCHNSLSKEVFQAYVWESFEFIEKFVLTQLSLIIVDIAIWVGHIVGLSEFYLQ